MKYIPKYIPTHEELVEDVLNFIKKSDTNPSEFGKKHLSDSGAISRLENNNVDPRLSTVQRIYKVLNNNH